MDARTERRRSPRLRLRLPVDLLWEEDGQQHLEHTFTRNISWYGCAVLSHRDFEPKTAVRVRKDGKTMEGRVVHSLKDCETNLVEVGIGFDQDAREFWGVLVWSE